MLEDFRIPGDDLQKYHQMIQAAKHSLSLSPAPEASFLMELLELEMISAVFFLELLVPVWAGASNHRIPAKRQIIFQIELSENSVENARKTADFGIESNKNLFRHQLRLGFAKQASCIGCPNQKDSAR